MYIVNRGHLTRNHKKIGATLEAGLVTHPSLTRDIEASTRPVILRHPRGMDECFTNNGIITFDGFSIRTGADGATTQLEHASYIILH